MLLVLQILIILVGTKLAGDVSVRLGQPAVLGKLLIGILIGPAVLGWIDNSEMLKQLSEIGVLLLMFLAGLETDIQELNRSRTSSLAVAVGGVIFPFVGGYLTGIYIGMSDFQALFLGLLLSATSVSISVQTLRDIGKLQSRESVTILGAAIADDILVVVLLAFLMSFSGMGDNSLLMVMMEKVFFFLMIFLLGWKVVPWVMRWVSSLRVSETASTAALIIVFSFSYFAEYLGVAGIIGSFAAGLAISRTHFRKEVEEKLQPIAYAVFVPIFFVSIGLPVTFDGLSNQLWLIIGLSILAILTKLIGSGLGARLTGFNTRSSLVIGSGMISRGEVALIIATLGLQNQLLAQEFYTAAIIVVLVTTLITPPLLKALFR